MKTNVKIFKLIIGLAVVFTLNSCQETIGLEEHQKSTSELLNRNDSLERIYIATLDEIDNNLDMIKYKQGVLILGPNTNVDFGTSKKQQIINNISMINTLLEDNKLKIASLEKSLSYYKAGKKELIHSIDLTVEKVKNQQKQIEDFKTALIERDFKINELNNTIQNQNLSIQNQDKSIQELAQLNKSQETKLNKTYFTYGTYKQLKQKHVIQNKSGLLSLKKVKVLSKDINKEEFSEIDMYKNTAISMYGKNPEIISTHPDGTYKLERKSDELALLTISDPENFWKVSKYLVVQVH